VSCDLCDLPTPDPPVTDEAVDGAFCCRGCLTVARRLDDADVDVAAADAEVARDRLDDGEGTVAEADGETAYLAVDGMHCATCEAFVESQARAADGVAAAEASYASDLVKVAFDADRTGVDDVATALTGLGYEAAPVEAAGTRDESETVGRLLVGGFFGMMTMLWYVLFLYPAYLGLEDLLLFDPADGGGAYLLWNAWAMTSVVVFYTGYPILRGAYVSLRAGYPNMDLLVALAATTAYVYSTLGILVGRVEVYFDISVVVVLAVTVGGYYERRIKRAAAEGLRDLTESRVAEARVRRDGTTETVPVEEVEAGAEVVVEPGERIPVDGEVVAGEAAVDESLVTGESVPVRRGPGDEAVGGAVVADGRLVVAAAGGDSALDRLLALLWDIQSSRPGAQRLADRLAAVFVPAVVLLAAAATAVRLLTGTPLADAVLTGLAVLVVSCPCALGLATPLAVASGVRDALEAGVVVTDDSVFESATETDVVAFDKTGTLTTGEMRLVDHHGEGLARAAAVERYADHPVAGAVADAADADGATDATVTGFETHPGRGVSAAVDGERVVVGRRALFEEREWAVPDALDERCAAAREAGDLPTLVGWDGRARGVLVATDDPRPGWRAALDRFDDRQVVVLTGDEERAVARFRDHDAVDEVFAGVPPEAKAEVIERLRRRGTVAMVGDGSNDAPALAAADLGIAMGGGTELAADAADVVVTGGVAAVPAVFEVTAAARRRIRQNLGWAFLYNAVAVPLALAGLINPLFAALAMATSSLLVVGNSARALPLDRTRRPTDGPGGDDPAAGAGDRTTAGAPAVGDGGRPTGTRDGGEVSDP
jgi:Cu2+-exporting ATPase